MLIGLGALAAIGGVILMDLRSLIKLHEGLSLTPYRDQNGYWTIGFGHNLDAHGESIPNLITNQQAEAYLTSDINDAMQAARQIVPNFDTLNTVRQAVIVDMIFNMGQAGVSQFHDMIQAVANGDWLAASEAMADSLWAYQLPERSQQDIAMMRTGEWL